MAKNTIEITRINKINKEGSNLKAFVNVTVNGIEIKGVTVKEGSKGFFVAMPQNSYKDKDGKTQYSNIVYITDESLRGEVEEAIFEAFAAAE